MTIDIATMQDRFALEEIWKKSFDVDSEFLDLFFDGCFQNSDTFIIRNGTRIISCLSAIHTSISSRENTSAAVYIYGVCTLPEYRGQHLMRLLLSEAEIALQKKGVMFSFLKPAEPSLYSLYSKCGYKQKIRHKIDIISLRDTTTLPFDAHQYRSDIYSIDLPHFNVLRGTSAKNYINWSDDMLRYILRYYHKYGYKIHHNENFYIFSKKDDERKERVNIIETSLRTSIMEERKMLERVIKREYPNAKEMKLESYFGKNRNYQVQDAGLIKKLGSQKIENLLLSFPME